MAAPSYLNVGTSAVSAGATSRTPALPASRTNGNILIAVVGSKNNATHSISGSGWASLASQTNSGTGWTVSYWWRVVDGTEAAPTISWTGSVACFGQIVQYTRQNSDTAAPFGTIGTAGTGTGATHTSTGFNSTRNNSLIIYLDAAIANTAIATPTNWTERFDAGSATSVTRFAGGDRTLTTSGSASGNISVTGAAAAWVQRQFELLEPILTGTLAGTESGSDTASITGLVEITGSLAATEIGSDTFAAAGDVVISGSLAAQESGSDTFAASGTVLAVINGSISAQETGSDSLAASGTVTSPVVHASFDPDYVAPRAKFWSQKQSEWLEDRLEQIKQAAPRPRKARKRIAREILTELPQIAESAPQSLQIDVVRALAERIAAPSPDYTAIAAVVAAQMQQIEAERTARRRKRDVEAVLILAA